MTLNFVSSKVSAGLVDKEKLNLIKNTQEKHRSCLRIPRRPVWKTADYDAKELQLKERESFLEWRRNLAL